jgi:hypothetical protein
MGAFLIKQHECAAKKGTVALPASEVSICSHLQNVPLAGRRAACLLISRIVTDLKQLMFVYFVPGPEHNEYFH